jgi:hypothetical protein
VITDESENPDQFAQDIINSNKNINKSQSSSYCRNQFDLNNNLNIKGCPHALDSFVDNSISAYSPLNECYLTDNGECSYGPSGAMANLGNVHKEKHEKAKVKHLSRKIEDLESEKNRINRKIMILENNLNKILLN